MNESLEGWENVSNEYKIYKNKLDFIIVLAGGLTETGKLNEWVIRRLDRAIELHEINKCPILCCGGGTYHKPPYINEKGFVIHESTECVNYLVQQGIDKNNIYREWSSYDTIANAFFSLTSHILCNLNFKNIGIITSEFHMPRSKEIFDWIYNLVEHNYKLNYFPVTDFGLNEEILDSRIEREKNSKKNVLILKEKIKSMREFHEWFYKEHNAYNNNFLYIEKISEKCKNSY